MDDNDKTPLQGVEYLEERGIDFRFLLKG